ncbi:MAG: hypothetical protein HFI87_00790 [Bacilli bacterium]|nr:hypothetical protein [Bacilli bacterium]
MPNYTNLLIYLKKLNQIMQEKNWNDDITANTLIGWLLYFFNFYDANSNILDNFSLDDYIKNSFEKLRQTESLKIIDFLEIINNPKCILYSHIKKIPANIIDKVENRLSKKGENYFLDPNGDYYLSAYGVNRGGAKIELVNRKELEYTLQHELQHVNQVFAYPSEFPFPKDMLNMLNEGEAEYHSNLINYSENDLLICPENLYHIYYLTYTLLMMVIPKEMCNAWNKADQYNHPYIFPEIFKYISNTSESRNHFSDIFSLVTIIVASCNSENTEEIFSKSVDKSLNRCSKRLCAWDEIVFLELESDRKNILESQNRNNEFLKENMILLQNPDLLKKKYLEIINEEKEYIASQSKNLQNELLSELELFTLERFKDQIIENIKNSKEKIKKCQNKKEKSPKEILGNVDYQQYQYYQFGMSLNKKMQVLLNQKLTFTELFEQLLQKVSNYLIESKDTKIEEKLAFIDKIKNNNLQDSKKM